MKPEKVYVYRTSPETLLFDIKRALSGDEFKRLQADEPTVIKINGNCDKIYPGSNTSPWFLDALLKTLRDMGLRHLSVAEGDLPNFKAANMIKTTGLIDILNKYDVPFVPYERLPRDEYEIPMLFRESQIISVPVFHTHGFAVISCATKNLFGLLPVYRRKYHHILSEKLLELAEQIEFFTIVDGTVGLDGESTRRGNPIRCDLILTGWNPLAVDVVAAKVMGFSLSDIPLLRLAVEKKILNPQVELVGDFNWQNIPNYQFELNISVLRKIAKALQNTPLLRFSPILWFLDRIRKLYHFYSYTKKKEILFQGAWMEYEKVWMQKSL